MEEARRQAEAIAADKRHEETIKNLLNAATNMKWSSREFGRSMEASKDAIEKLIYNTPSEHKQTAINTQNAAIKLLSKLKAGGDVNETIEQLKKLL